jgi:hypothetical protein
MKIPLVGAEFSVRIGRQTDMTKLTVAFRNFANAPKNEGVNRAVISLITNWGILLPSC